MRCASLRDDRPLTDFEADPEGEEHLLPRAQRVDLLADLEDALCVGTPLPGLTQELVARRSEVGELPPTVSVWRSGFTHRYVDAVSLNTLTEKETAVPLGGPPSGSALPCRTVIHFTLRKCSATHQEEP